MTRSYARWLRFASMAVGLCLLGHSTSHAAQYQVAIDTAALSGTAFVAAFDFIDGGTPSNSVSITQFQTDGTLAPATSTGSTSGSPPGPFTLTDTSFFSELLQPLNGASFLTFIISSTQNAPDIASAPDGLSFFLLDPASNLPLVHTSDPTGADALFVLSIDGTASAALLVNTPSPAAPAVGWSVIAAVPEPQTALSLTVGCMVLVYALRLRRRYSNIQF